MPAEPSGADHYESIVKSGRIPSAGAVYRPDLAPLVSPAADRDVPVQRWFLYPHSFSKSLVQHVMNYLAIDKTDRVCDPFVGAGSTLMACRELQVSAHGLDVLPVSTWVSNTKVRQYDNRQLRTAKTELIGRLASRRAIADVDDGGGLSKYLGAKTNVEVRFILDTINKSPVELQSFFQLALIRNILSVAKVTRDGGWLRWKKDYVDRPTVLRTAFMSSVNLMTADVAKSAWRGREECSATLGDARNATLPSADYRLIIGSPPYLNRHDYTRLLSVEMLTQFVKNTEELKTLRYLTLRSHVEARPPSPDLDCTGVSRELRQVISELDRTDPEPRIRKMILGYFSDLALVFSNISRFVKTGGFVTLIVSDSRFNGVRIPVRAVLNEIAINFGFRSEVEWLLRWRGNSSQQMGKYGRAPVAEAVLIWRKQ